jgi:hypothetical protein
LSFLFTLKSLNEHSEVNILIIFYMDKIWPKLMVNQANNFSFIQLCFDFLEWT